MPTRTGRRAEQSIPEPSPSAAVMLSNPQSFLLAGVVVVSLGVLVCLALAEHDGIYSPTRNFLSLATVGAASMAVGGIVGFLFGVPRTPAADSLRDSNGNSSPYSDAHYRPNSSLEQVCDWLTKILLGAGLTQLGNIAPLAMYLETSLKISSAIAISVVIFSSAVGFLGGYLITIRYLAQLIATSHRRLNEEVFDEIIEDGLYDMLYCDAPQGFLSAIDMAEAYLDQKPNSDPAHFYLSVAYAQAYRYETEKPKKEQSPSSLRQFESSAYDHAKSAIELDPKNKAILRSLWKPDDSNNDEDNDLECFKDNDKFKQLLSDDA